MTVAGLLLAAGEGRRMGRPKALLEVGGRSLLERGVHLLRDGGCAPVVVVLGAQADAAARLADGADVVVAEGWQEGMGASLRAGLQALEATPATACVVALADQPLVGAEAVRRLAGRAGAVEAAVATYDGRPRNPVLLARAVWPEVAALAQGDTGARAWLRANPARVEAVPCDGTGAPTDLDTPADLAAVRPAVPATAPREPA